MMTGLYSGATGMKSMSTGLSVISNNVANLNTVAYKQDSTLYADLMSSYMTGSASTSVTTSQLGLGAAVGSVRTIFTQGGFESSNSVTDLGIDGIGFFAVSNGSVTEYTRAGNFSFLSTGELVDASGWNLMGYSITDGVKSSSLSPVVIDTSASGVGTMAAKATTSIVSCSQLGGLEDATTDAANPFFALASSWNGTADPPLSESAYSYSQAIQFYDSNGTLQNATIYYDLAGTDSGQTAVEYVVALDDPSLDGSSLAGTDAAGLLMAGTMTFSSAGELQSLTAFTPPSSGLPSDLANWNPASLADGSPAFSVSIAGADTQTIGLNMGLTLNGSTSAGLANAAAAAANPSAIYAVDTSATANSNKTNAYGDSLGQVYTFMDGYTTGSLQDITVSTDGTITGKYSNGQNMDLYQIPLYRFNNEDGLQKTGDNHYAATKDSGAAQEGVAGTENFGTINECALEQSNVDLATEFSNLIVTQRGFQMNSKVITTCDQLLQKALELKR
ncbi:MAG: hypothetical protein DELT_00102 [Desulfovibrio sp.]